MKKTKKFLIGAKFSHLLVLIMVVVIWSVLTHGVKSQSPYDFQVENNSPIGGTVTSSPAGINCGADCSASFTDGTSVTLTATVTNPEMKLVSWGTPGSGIISCSGGNNESPCAFTMPSSSSLVSVTWEYKNVSAKITKAGTGSGTVTSSPAGINCGGDCSGTYSGNTTVTLTAKPAEGSKFVGWEADGTICYGGEKGSPTRNTNAICSAKLWADTKTYTAVARFDKKSTAGSSTGTGSSASDPVVTASGAPVAPKVSTIQVAGTKVDASKPVEMAQDQPLVISGKTVANATVTLYIFSEPQKDTTKADKDGNWSYTITGLPEGSHRVEAEVTDPKTKKTSKRAKLLEFTVTAATPTTAVTAAPEVIEEAKTVSKGLLAVTILVLATLGGGGFYYWRNKKTIHLPRFF